MIEGDFGRAVKLCRNAKRMTQGDLAARAGMTTSYLSLIERNQRDPNLSVAERISDALNVPLSIMLFIGLESKDRVTTFSPDIANEISRLALDLMSQQA